MDFFAQQDRARRNTKLLVFYFVCAVVTITAGVYVGLAAVLEWRHSRWGEARWLWQPTLLAYSVVGTLAVIGFGTLVKLIELRAGGSAVADSLGGQLIQPNTSDPDERRVLNVVEEMAIASGVPVPQTYLLPQEDAINAFAAGYSPGDSVVGVTRGCIRHLNRDELQGAIAHEFSHILNGDMRLNLRLMGLLHGILCLALIGRFLLRSSGNSSRSSRSEKGGNVIASVGVVLYAIGSLGAFFGALIKAAVSRQREFLADASSVQFTRNPDGMAGALKKIGGLAAGSFLQHPNADLASHMYFANGVTGARLGAFATHPRLVDRILAIEPTFDGKFPRLPVGRASVPAPVSSTSPAGARRSAIPVPVFLAAAGGPTPQRLAYAADVRVALPAELLEAVQNPLSATAVVMGLLLSRDPGARQSQGAGLADLLDGPSAAELNRLQSVVETVPRRLRLPLLLLSAPALRELSPEQFTRFETTVQYLIEHDAQMELFEFTLQHFIRRQLAPTFHPVPRRAAQFYSLRALTAECVTLLSALAHVSGEGADVREAAFRRGLGPLGLDGEPPGLRPLTDCGVDQVGAALDRLNELTPMLKKVVLAACVEVVAHDGLIQTDEAELLRAIADALDCPIPPVISGV